jgi:hypothetical protein
MAIVAVPHLLAEAFDGVAARAIERRHLAPVRVRPLPGHVCVHSDAGLPCRSTIITAVSSNGDGWHVEPQSQDVRRAIVNACSKRRRCRAARDARAPRRASTARASRAARVNLSPAAG